VICFVANQVHSPIEKLELLLTTKNPPFPSQSENHNALSLKFNSAASLQRFLIMSTDLVLQQSNEVS
jgi:hypothetical protein